MTNDKKPFSLSAGSVTTARGWSGDNQDTSSVSVFQ